MYGLHSLQGQFTGFHFLTSLLKAFTVSNCVNSLGTISQILGPIIEVLSEPLTTHRTFRLIIHEHSESRRHYYVYQISLSSVKLSSYLTPQIFLLQVLCCKFLTCIVTPHPYLVVLEMMIYYHYVQYVDTFCVRD